MISALGSNPHEIRRQYWDTPRHHFTLIADSVPDREVLAAQVQDALPEIPDDLSRFICRNNQLLLKALEPIVSSVQEAITCFGPERVGIVLGTSTSGISDGEKALAHRLKQGSFPVEYRHLLQEIGSLSCFLKAHLSVTGPAYTISTACSSSAKAFSSARNLLDMGVCDAVITGGCDTLCNLTLCGFSSLDAISQTPTNPMSINRSGLTIGEGAALFIMTREPGPVELLGVGESSDAHHISAPDPEGSGAEVSMRMALAEAGLKPENVQYINLHGTGTPQNDLMESLAVERVFGSSIPCSSTKAMHGHTLGAAGAVESAICWMLCSDSETNRHLPVHLWDGERDPALGKITLVEPGQCPDQKERFICLSNSFAFGGSNCSVLFGAENG